MTPAEARRCCDNSAKDERPTSSRILHSVAETFSMICLLFGLAVAQLQEPLPRLNYAMVPDCLFSVECEFSETTWGISISLRMLRGTERATSTLKMAMEIRVC